MRADELIERAIAAALREMFTLEVATVVSYDATKRTASVRLAMRRWLPDEDGAPVQEEAPEIPGARVLFLGGGGALLTYNLQPGDAGVLFLMRANSDPWFVGSGAVADVRDLRTNHLGGTPVFLAGLVLNSGVGSQPADPDVVIDPGTNRIKLGKLATDFVALAQKVDDNLSDIATTLASLTVGTPAVPGPVTPGTVIVAASPYVPTPTAATKVKAI